MKKYFFILAVFFMAIASSGTAFCQRQYTLSECINVALANNYDLLYTQHQQNYANVLQKQALGAYLPNISGSASYSRSLNSTDQSIYTGQIINLNNNSLSLMLNANWLLYDGGTREANYTNASNQQKLIGLQKQYLTEQLKLQIYTQFVNVLRLQEIVKTRQEDIKVSISQLENFNARYEAGVIPVEAVLSQEAELGSKEIALLTQQIELNTAKQNLLITMGQNPVDTAEFVDASIPANITEQSIISFNASIGNLQDIIAFAFTNRIDYSSYVTSQEIAQTTLDGTSGNYFPTLQAGFNYGYNGWDSWTKNDLGGSFSVNLNVPIFNNYATDLAVQQSELSLQQENTNLKKLEQSINAEVQTAYFNLESAEKAINISKKSLAAAQQNYEAVREKMNVGNATITDYITANSQFITAKINIITSTYSYITAQKSLLFTVGQYE